MQVPGLPPVVSELFDDSADIWNEFSSLAHLFSQYKHSPWLVKWPRYLRTELNSVNYLGF